MSDEEYGYFVFDQDDYVPPFEPVLTMKELRSPKKPPRKFKRYVLFECNGIQIYTQTPIQWYPTSSFSTWRHTWNSIISLLTAIYKYPSCILSRKFSQ